ncbi:hypothetical protein BGZ95_010934 [Linnemannia exigua]|uniref:Cyclin N-terminal domain-containing protein n=1 Tax=Linnemannia exigua TaxID=604196 RepID=A0AAD4H6S9_9FUNG|nr:hypothetical protein BGZ95_010934 [Linnemannia exigua]
MLTRPTGLRQPRTRQQDENRLATELKPFHPKAVPRSSSDMTPAAVVVESWTRSAKTGSSDTSRIPLKIPLVSSGIVKLKSAKEQLLNRTSAASALTELTNGTQNIRISTDGLQTRQRTKESKESKELKDSRRPIVLIPVPSVPASATASATATAAPAPVSSETFAQQSKSSASVAAPDRPRPNRAPPTLARTVSAPPSSSLISVPTSSTTKRHSYANPLSVSTRLTSTRPDAASIQKSSIAHRSLRNGHPSTHLPTTTQAQVKAQAALAQVTRERVRPISNPSVPLPPSAPKVPPAQRHRTEASTSTRSVPSSVRRPNVQKLAKPMAQPTIPRLRARPVIPSVPLFNIAMEIESPQHGVPDMDMDFEAETDGFDADPSFVSEYQDDIFAYKREMEIKHLPDPTYMDRQVDLSWHYRVRLIEWLVEVHDRFDLLQETMHLCINYLDRFLSKISIPIDQLQLAGTVALLLASKYEEIQSPAIAELSFLGGDAYPPSRIRQAEIGMLRALNYDMGAPGPMSFLRRISRADDFDIEIRTLAKYLLDVTLCDHRFIGVPSSMVAAVGYRASMLLLDRGEWSKQHAKVSGYAANTLSAGINVLLTMLEQPETTHLSLFNKYKDEKFMESSTYVQSLGLTKLRSLHISP